MRRQNAFLTPRSLFLGVAAVSLGLAFLVPPEGVTHRIFGPVPVPLAVILATIAGWWALNRLQPGTVRLPWLGVLIVGALFLIPVAAIDIFVPFPEDVNMALPGALAFYPVAGFVAEVVFHLLPLAIVAVVLGRRDLPLWAFLPAALSEPFFQAVASGGATVQGVLVAAHVAVFSAVQLWFFRTHGFAAMYALRLSYYFFWHLLWGALRLELLF